MLFRINKTRTRYKLRDSKVSAAFHVHNYTITGGCFLPLTALRSQLKDIQFQCDEQNGTAYYSS